MKNLAVATFWAEKGFVVELAYVLFGFWLTRSFRRKGGCPWGFATNTSVSRRIVLVQYLRAIRQMDHRWQVVGNTNGTKSTTHRDQSMVAKDNGHGIENSCCFCARTQAHALMSQGHTAAGMTWDILTVAH